MFTFFPTRSLLGFRRTNQLSSWEWNSDLPQKPSKKGINVDSTGHFPSSSPHPNPQDGGSSHKKKISQNNSQKKTSQASPSRGGGGCRSLAEKKVDPCPWVGIAEHRSAHGSAPDRTLPPGGRRWEGDGDGGSEAEADAGDRSGARRS